MTSRNPTPQQLQAWSLRVRRAAFFVCDKCKYQHRWWSKRRELHAHHLYDKSTYPKKALDFDNGKCLCEKCHSKFHNDFMGGTSKSCTKWDYYVWKYSGWVWVGLVLFLML